jgi:hypothetical protein
MLSVQWFYYSPVTSTRSPVRLKWRRYCLRKCLRPAKLYSVIKHATTHNNFVVVQPFWKFPFSSTRVLPLPCSQERSLIPILSQMNPLHTDCMPIRSVKTLFSHIMSVSVFQVTCPFMFSYKSLYVFLFCSVCHILCPPYPSFEH